MCQLPSSTLTLAMSSSRQPVLSPPEEDLEPLPLTAVEEQQMQEGTASIADPDLREAVRQSLAAGMASEKVRGMNICTGSLAMRGRVWSRLGLWLGSVSFLLL